MTKPMMSAKGLVRNTRRRGRNEGSIFQRGDGRWTATLSVGYDSNGKRKRRTIYGANKKEVQDKLARLQGGKLDGLLVDLNKLSVSKYLARWLDEAAKPSIRPTTYVSYEGVIRLHINPGIGGVALSQLTPVHVQSLYSSMADKGASARLRQLTHAVLRRALKQAVRWNLVVRNVCDAVTPPKVSKVEIVPLTAAQSTALIKTTENDRLGAIYAVALTTGMRLGELLGLQWESVDLDDESLMVRHTLTEVRGQLSLTEPKTAKSRRRIELPMLAVLALWDHKKKMLAEGHAKSGYVFCNVNGGPLRRSNFERQQFKPALKRAELPDVRFHDLRHSAASLLLSVGVHAKVVQEMLGHSQISLTLDTYSHCIRTLGKDAAGQFDKLLAAAVS